MLIAKFVEIDENLNFAIWKKVFSNFVGLLDHNGQTQIYRLVSGQSDAWLWRNRDFPTEDDDLEKCVPELFRTATIEPRQIERSGFFLLNHNGQT